MKNAIRYIWLPFLLLIISLSASLAIINHVDNDTKQSNIELAISVADSKLNRMCNTLLTITDRCKLNATYIENNPTEVSTSFEFFSNYILDSTSYIDYLALYDSNGDLTLSKSDKDFQCDSNIFENETNNKCVELLNQYESLDSVYSELVTCNDEKYFYIVYDLAYTDLTTGYYLIKVNLDGFISDAQPESLLSQGYEYEFFANYYNSNFVIASSGKTSRFQITIEIPLNEIQSLSLVLYSENDFVDMRSHTIAVSLSCVIIIIIVALCINISLVLNRSLNYKKESRFDVLTHVPNERAELIKLIELEKSGKPYLFFYLDIDNFKGINDKYGHDAGDEVLQKVARLLTLSVKTEDLVSRIHGDEFSIIMEGDYSELRARDIEENISNALSTQINVQGKLIKLSVSLGFAIVPVEAKRYDEAIKLADKKMYECKNRHKEEFKEKMSNKPND